VTLRRRIFENTYYYYYRRYEEEVDLKKDADERGAAQRRR